MNECSAISEWEETERESGDIWPKTRNDILVLLA